MEKGDWRPDMKNRLFITVLMVLPLLVGCAKTELAIYNDLSRACPTNS